MKVCGVKTSEYQVALITSICGLVAALYGVDGGAIGAALLPAVTYIGGRSYVKRNENAQMVMESADNAENR
jgi:hypothetical protein